MQNSQCPSTRDMLDKGLSKVKALVTDVDGVLTDGSVFMLDSGQWRRQFYIQDGLGLKHLVAQGIKVAFITGSESEDILQRASALGVDSVFQGVESKLPVIESILKKWDIPLSDTLYIGDDLPDLPVLEAVGFPVIVPHAHNCLLQNTNFYMTTGQGGFGAVREVADVLLEAKGV